MIKFLEEYTDSIGDVSGVIVGSVLVNSILPILLSPKFTDSKQLDTLRSVDQAQMLVELRKEIDNFRIYHERQLEYPF